MVLPQRLTTGAASLAGLAALYVLVIRPRTHRWGASDAEVAHPMPGDEIVGHTRLLTRVRAKFPWETPACGIVADIGDVVMMRKTLLGIKARAERLAREAELKSGGIHEDRR